MMRRVRNADNNHSRGRLCHTHSHTRGFTLLEVLLAVTLSVGLMAGVLGFYRQTVMTRAAVMDRAQSVRAQRVAMDRITDELRAATYYPFLSVNMTGDRLEFICAGLPSPAVWSPQKLTDAPPPPEHDLRLVSYRLRTWTDEDNVVHIDGLERSEQKVLKLPDGFDPTSPEARGVIESSLIAEPVQFVRFQYWDGTTWQDGWSNTDLPTGVRITIGMYPLPENVTPDEYPYESFSRIVFVPGGTKAFTGSGTIIQGLGGGT